MRLLRGLLVSVLLLGGFACGDSNRDSIVVVTVTAAPNMPAISQLRATIGTHPEAGPAATEAQLFPAEPSAQALVFDASFALLIPRHRQGNLDVVVEALDMGGNVAATGAGSVLIVVGGRTKLIVHLGSAESDAGVPADGAVDASSERFGDGPRLDSVVDLVDRDGPNAAEAGNADVASADAAGASDGSAGAGGSGGAGGIDGGAATGGVGGGGGLGGWDGPGIDDAADGARPDGAAGADGNANGPSDGPSMDSADGRSDLPYDRPTDVFVLPDATDGLVDGGPVACASTVQCPVYPKCRIQPTCDSTLGVCTQPAQCSVCGNGVVEFSEECDDGNTISGDHCSSTCKTEYCGDGIVQSYTLAGLSLIYLARSCGGAVSQDIWMILNGVEVARSTVPQTCSCEPGILTVPVTNPAFLALGNNGPNVVEVHTHAEISWAVVHYESPSGPGERYFIDSGSNGAAQYRRPNLCTNGSQQGGEVGITLTLAGGEQCDHGNLNGTPGDHCTANCLVQ